MSVWCNYHKVNGKRVQAGPYQIRMNDLRGCRVQFSSGTRSRTVAKEIERKVIELRDLRRANLQPDQEMDRWIINQPAEFLAKIAELGFIEPRRLAAARHVLDHLNDWRAYLKSRAAEHSKNWRWKANMVEAIVKELGVRSAADIEPQAVNDYVQELLKRGMATKTAGDYAANLKSFCSWMVKNRYLAFNPLDSVQRPPFKARYKRRVETPENIQKLIFAAYEGPTMSVHGTDGKDITGPDRGILYWFAAETGAREIQCRCLTVGDFVLDAVQPYVQLHKHNHKGGEKSGAKRPEGVPLRNATLVAALRAYFGKRKKDDFAFRVPRCIYVAMRKDMERAKLPIKDADGRVFDFHGLRHSFATHAINSGMDLHLVKQMVGHISPTVTEEVYLHTRLEDMSKGMKSIPQYEGPVQIKLVGGA